MWFLVIRKKVLPNQCIKWPEISFKTFEQLNFFNKEGSDCQSSFMVCFSVSIRTCVHDLQRYRSSECYTEANIIAVCIKFNIRSILQCDLFALIISNGCFCGFALFPSHFISLSLCLLQMTYQCHEIKCYLHSRKLSVCSVDMQKLSQHICVKQFRCW